MHRQLIAKILLYTLLLPLLTGCEQAAVVTPVPQTITISGATSMQRVLHALSEEYTRQHPNILFNLREGGSTLGEERVARGEIDMAASTLFPPRADDSGGTTTPDPLVRTPIGLDGVAIIVHPRNRIAGLTAVELGDLYSGRILDWATLGGEPGEVVLVSREEGSGTRVLFEERIMNAESVSLTAVVMPSSADVAAYVSSHPQAIGYLSAAYTTARGEEAPVRILPLDEQLPTAENLLSRQYLLIQPLYLITVGEPNGRVRQFLDFVLGPTGQEIVARYHAPVR